MAFKLKRFALAQFEKVRYRSRKGTTYARFNLEKSLVSDETFLYYKRQKETYVGVDPRSIAATIGERSII